MFDDSDVADFLENDLGQLDTYNGADDHPFCNAWHDGSWIYEARSTLSVVGAGLGIAPDEQPAFLQAVGRLATQRGYGDGNIED